MSGYEEHGEFFDVEYAGFDVADSERIEAMDAFLDDYDIVDGCGPDGQPRSDSFTKALKEMPLMEGRAWHGWSGMIEAGWVQMVAGPTRHLPMPETFGLPHRHSWPYEPSDAERDQKLGERRWSR